MVVIWHKGYALGPDCHLFIAVVTHASIVALFFKNPLAIEGVEMIHAPLAAFFVTWSVIALAIYCVNNSAPGVGKLFIIFYALGTLFWCALGVQADDLGLITISLVQFFSCVVAMLFIGVKNAVRLT